MTAPDVGALRRAAKILREHAEAAEDATPGRWTVEQDDDAWELYAGRGEFHGFKIAKCMKRHQRYMEYWPPEPHSAYIAMMDPAVGLMLADILDRFAENHARWNPPSGHTPDSPLASAMALARKILREADDMPDTPQVTVRTTEAGRVTEVVVPYRRAEAEWVVDMIRAQVPRAEVFDYPMLLAIRQPGGPNVVALAGETLRIAAGRVERVREDERRD